MPNKPALRRAIQHVMNDGGYPMPVDGIWGRKSATALADIVNDDAPAPAVVLIKDTALYALSGRINMEVAKTWADVLGTAAAAFNIDTSTRAAHWLAQLSVECEGFTRFEENLRYRTPSRLDALFSAVRGEADARALIAAGPEAIANRVYANRNGNSDEASGDGWRFRGRGPVQQTGRRNYGKASVWTGIDLVAAPDRLLEPAIGALAAAGYWKACALNDDADRGDVDAITQAINGPAMAAAAERREATRRALRLIG